MTWLSWFNTKQCHQITRPPSLDAGDFKKTRPEKMACLEDVGTIKWWCCSFWENEVHFFKNLEKVCCVFSLFNFEGFGWWWLWPGSAYLCSIEKWDVEPTISPTTELWKGEIWPFFPWNLLRMELASPKKYCWRWDCQNILDFYTMPSLKRLHRVEVLLTKGGENGWTKIDEMSPFIMKKPSPLGSLGHPCHKHHQCPLLGDIAE